MGYYYKDLHKIESIAGSIAFNPNEDFLEKHPHLIKLQSTNLHIRPEYHLNIEVSRMKKNDYSDLVLKAIVAYENKKTSIEQVIKTKSQGYDIFLSEKLINVSHFMKNTNFCIIKSKKYIYQFKISGGFKSDIPHFLNSIEIEGDKLKVTYDANKIVKSVKMEKH